MKKIIESTESIEIRLQGSGQEILKELREIQNETVKKIRVFFSRDDWMGISMKMKQEIIKILDELKAEFDQEHMSSARTYTVDEIHQRQINKKIAIGREILRNFQDLLSGKCPEILVRNPEIFSAYPGVQSPLSTHENIGVVSNTSGVSICNLKAVAWVMRKNPTLFPAEASENPLEWLSQNPDLWTERGGDPQSNIRYGLISGFDRKSVEFFQQDDEAKGKIETLFGDVEGARYRDLVERKDWEKLRKFLSESTRLSSELTLTEAEIDAHVRGQQFKAPDIYYCIYDKDAEARYRSESEERILNCGVEPSEELTRALKEIDQEIEKLWDM
jgi:hypothetical protein